MSLPAPPLLTLKILNKSRVFLNAGFTLVEVLVAITILALIGAVAIPNLRQFNQSQEVDNASADLLRVLRQAQSSASSGTACESSVGTNPIVALYWGVKILDSRQFQLVAKCRLARGGFSGPELSYYTSLSVSRIRYAYIGTPPCTSGNLTVLFSGPYNKGQGVAYSCSASDPPSNPSLSQQIQITVGDGTRSRTIHVENGGAIYLQ